MPFGHLKNPTPGLSGEMQVTQRGQYPGKSSILFFFLPMIDRNPSDLSCVYSTLLFVCREARRYQRPHVLIFDQPLFWKAMTIFWNEPDNSHINGNTIGCLYTEMSFLSCIEHIMEGTWNSRNIGNNLRHKHSSSYAKWKSHRKGYKGSLPNWHCFALFTWILALWYQPPIFWGKWFRRPKISG